MLSKIRRLIPAPLLNILLPSYHFLLAYTGAVYYGFPSRELIVVGITGTKGKSSTAEILDNIFEDAGYKCAVLGTIKFKIGNTTERNLKKMTMPGRFFVQKFMRDAVDAGCTHAVIEMTSEGAKQYRQRFIDMDALIFTNLSPEHIESHGSYEKYRDAKLAIARTLARSTKRHRYMFANGDDAVSKLFLSIPNITPIAFSLSDAVNLVVDETHSEFHLIGTLIASKLGGMHNVMNILGAATCAMRLGVPPEMVATGVAKTKVIAGRMEAVDAGQRFPVIVDYAHTPDSLEAIYKTFAEHTNVCVLGNTGGGRDKWKRPVMGAIAEKYCDTIILTNEDPYDEDPRAILDEMASGIKEKKPIIILDRRDAIMYALKHAWEIADRGLLGLDEVQGDKTSVSEGAYSRKSSGPLVAVNKEIRQNQRPPAVLITGKGTDPYIMGPCGSKAEWDDRTVAKEEITKLIRS